MDLNKVLPPAASLHMSGSGSIGKKITELTRRGKFQNLKDNQGSIVKVIGDDAQAIRRGYFGRIKQRGFIEKIKSMEKQAGRPLTLDDKRDLKEVAKYLGTPAERENSASAMEKVVPGEKSESEVKLEEKMAAREAVKAGVRPNQPITRIDRALANQTPATSQASSEVHSFSPYDHRSHQEEVKRVMAIGQVRRPGVAAPDDPRSQRDSHGTGLAAKDSHGTGLSSNRHLGLGLKDQAGPKNNNLPPPPRISLAA
jgi:hypothetical protein